MIDPAEIHSARILIVDDCCDTAGTLSELLKWKGYKCVSWTSECKAVLGLMTRIPFDLLLLDMHMPGLSGLEVMHNLYAKEVLHSIPVIAFSGDHRYRTVSVAAGACAFLLKPFQHEELEATIVDVLSRPISPSAKHALGASPLLEHAS